VSKQPSQVQSPHSYGTYFWITVIGCGIGWLIGLSVSEVVSIVITSLTGSAAAVIAVMSGLEKNSSDEGEPDKNNKLTQWQVNPIPLAVLIIGLFLGSSAGVWARNNHVLGSDVSAEVAKWSQVGLLETGVITKTELIRRVFEVQYPPNPSANPAPMTTQNSMLGTNLFATSVEECSILRKAAIDSPERLVKELERNEALKALPTIEDDPEKLERIIKEVLCP